MILSKLKVYGIALAGVVISALLVTVRLLTRSNSRLRARVENAEAKINHARVVASQDTDLDQQKQTRDIEIDKDRDSGRTDYDPNELFDKDDN